MRWSLMTELKKVFKKKRKHYRKSTQRPWQTIGLWGRRGKGRQNRSNHAKADHSYENSKVPKITKAINAFH